MQFTTSEPIEALNIKVVNVSGQTIHERNITNISEYSLECSGWQNGVYIVYITDNQGHTYQTKLIKN